MNHCLSHRAISLKLTSHYFLINLISLILHLEERENNTNKFDIVYPWSQSQEMVVEPMHIVKNFWILKLCHDAFKMSF